MQIERTVTKSEQRIYPGKARSQTFIKSDWGLPTQVCRKYLISRNVVIDPATAVAVPNFQRTLVMDIEVIKDGPTITSNLM